MNKGSVVVAVGQITEEVDGAEVVHAEQGDQGEVLDVLESAEWRMVRWSRAGTVCQCHLDEITSA